MVVRNGLSVQTQKAAKIKQGIMLQQVSPVPKYTNAEWSDLIVQVLNK